MMSKKIIILNGSPRAKGNTMGIITVSYTHLDVYKRQPMICLQSSGSTALLPWAPWN